MSDYLVRSQQLITLLVGQDRLNRQVQEAMKRVDWDYVKTQSSQVAQETADLLTQFERDVNARLRTAPKVTATASLPVQAMLDLDARA